MHCRWHWVLSGVSARASNDCAPGWLNIENKLFWYWWRINKWRKTSAGCVANELNRAMNLVIACCKLLNESRATSYDSQVATTTISRETSSRHLRVMHSLLPDSDLGCDSWCSAMSLIRTTDLPCLFAISLSLFLARSLSFLFRHNNNLLDTFTPIKQRPNVGRKIAKQQQQQCTLMNLMSSLN